MRISNSGLFQSRQFMACVLVLLSVITPGAPTAAHGQTLPEARKGFVTKPRPCGYQRHEPVPEPPSTYLRIKYKSPAGELVALLTPDPKDGKKRPAILWCHGGFGGLGDYYWQSQPAKNDQTPRAFLNAGFVVMLPSWRGENDNPGNYEMFLGEIDDAVAAVNHLAALPYVDPKRIYVVGHSTGGTIALLTGLSTDKVRAVFSFGGSPNMAALNKDWADDMPFEPTNPRELLMRSAVAFIKTLKTPAWYIEGEESGHVPQARQCQRLATDAKVPLQTAIIKGGDHFNILRPLTRYLAQRLLTDTATAEPFKVEIRPEDLQTAYDKPAPEPVVKRAPLPPFRFSEAAVTQWKKEMVAAKLRLDTCWVVVDNGQMSLVNKLEAAGYIVLNQAGLRIAIPRDQAESLRGATLDCVNEKGTPQFVLRPPPDADQE